MLTTITSEVKLHTIILSIITEGGFRALRLPVRYIGIGERIETSSCNAKLLLEIDLHAMQHDVLDAIELALCGSECL